MKHLGIIKLHGTKVNLHEEFGSLEISDLTTGMNNVAALMSYAAALWGEAEAEEIEADASYRQWRAAYGEDIRAADPKAAEWKVDQTIEATQEFLDCKTAIAAAKQNSVLLRGLFESLRVKASSLQSRGAMMRAELDKTDIHTLEESPSSTGAAATPRKDIKGIAGSKKTPVRAAADAAAT